MSPFKVPAWECRDCGADMVADGRHEKFHQQCWSCYRPAENGSGPESRRLDDAFAHYHVAWRWGADHLNDDTAAAAMTHAWLSIACSMLEVPALLERIADGLENLR